MLKHSFSTAFVAFLLVSLSAIPLKNQGAAKSFWIIWNVGQGQWSTLAEKNSCDHFDMGGERNPLRQVKKICADKMNRIYLSHWDWDHISFAGKAKSLSKDICLRVPPLGTSSLHKMKLLKVYRPCSSTQQEDFPLKELTHFTAMDSMKTKGKNSNELSHVLLVAKNFLIPGDSTTQQEKTWSTDTPMQKVKFLLLGHHGSRTSTSEGLLARLPQLKMAVASARFAKYGHPHLEVVQRLKRYHVVLLKTEDWGNLWFEISL
ncbi:MAG TPA: hydrolase [Pseudobdellovibrionaceae bacterium]|jgi:competence protein ComEC